MVEIITTAQDNDKEKNLDSKALRIFLKAIDLLGGPRKLFEFRNITWLPSLMEAAYVILLSEEEFKSAQEIAALLGLSKNTVQNILRAKEEDVKSKIFEKLPQEEEKKAHIAGGLAKLAYKEIKEGREGIGFLNLI